MSPSHEFPRTTSCVPFSSRVRGPSGAGLRARLPPSSFRRALRAHDTLFIPSTSFTQPTTVSAGLRQLLWYLIAGTRGGLNRARIIEALHERPYNANQLSEALEIDYRTIRHHLDLLRKNGLLARPVGDAYGSPYFLSAYLEGNYTIFEEIRKKLPSSRR